MTAEKVLVVYDKVIRNMQAKYCAFKTTDIRRALEEALREGERKDNGGEK